MSLLKQAQTNVNPNEIKGGKERDTLGGGGVQDTGVYGFTVDSAYTTEAKSGAIGIVLNVILDNQAKYSETFYITTGRDKGRNPYYEKNGEKSWLPSYVKLNSFVEMITGKDIFNADTEERVLDIYDWESKKNVQTKCEVLVDLVGKKGFMGLHKIRSNKQVKGDNGYVDSVDERFTNTIDKFFNENKQTSTEQEAKVAPDFVNKWVEKYGNATIDKYKAVAGVAAGAPARPTPNVMPTPSTAVNAAADNDLFPED